MKYLELNKDEFVEEFQNHLLTTNRGYNYYVDWDNVCGLDEYEIEIHALDVLIKVSDKEFYNKFEIILKKLPRVVEVFPLLCALAKNEREGIIKKNKVLNIVNGDIDSDDYDEYSFNTTVLDGKTMAQDLIVKYYMFFDKMGLKKLFQEKMEKSVWDYIVGVLVGLDSNGRKNRGGTVFEIACEPIISKVCDKYNLVIHKQIMFKSLVESYGIKVNNDIESRKADFIIIDEDKKKVLNLEVNFYNGTGSKPEEIINSYSDRQKRLEKCGIDFCLLTDGDCWRSSNNQLRVGFESINYLTNYRMAKKGMLEEIIKKIFNK